MALYFRKSIFQAPFDQFADELKKELYKEGFAIVSDADMRQILDDSRPGGLLRYEIISVAIPHLFREMLSLEPLPGAVLPLQITLSENARKQVEVLVVDPSSHVADASLLNLRDETRRRLTRVIELLFKKPAGIPDGLV